MNLTEFEEEAMKLFAEKYYEVCKERREEKMGILMEKLYSEGRFEEAKRAVRDSEFRKRLFEELGEII